MVRYWKMMVFLSLLVFLGYLYWSPVGIPTPERTIIRAALDIGSGATKLRVVDYSLSSHKIKKILFSDSAAVPYQDFLEDSTDNLFNAKIRDRGLKVLRKLKASAMEHQAKKIVGIATAAFRKADNGREFAGEISKKLDIDVHIIDQEMEGKINFYAVVAKQKLNKEETKNLVVWDIGGGSFQMTTLDDQGEFIIYRGDMASISFRNHVIDEIKELNPATHKSPNPMTLEEIIQATAHARTVGNDIQGPLAEKILNTKTVVYGVGALFNKGLRLLIDGKESFTTEELETAIEALANKSDEELNDPWAHVKITNAILVLGIMETLNIDNITLCDIHNADGAFLIEEFWK